MNIGSLFRGLLGDSRPGEAKSLELKEGQVVRGVVQSVSESGKEAVVQIQGTPVRAELETPLQPGQSLTLQVAPPGEGGLPVLKPVSLGEAALLSPQSMGEALETLGLKESKAGKEIIQAMQSGGLPLTKENAAKLDAIMNAKPQGVPTSEWLESAVLSVKRGLPVTAESVRGLQQAVFGPKLHELLAKLETELGAWVQQEEETGNGKAGGPAAAGRAGLEGAVNENASGRSVTGPRTALGGTQGAANGLAEDAVLPAENEAGETAAVKGAAGTQNNNAARTAAETAATAVDPQSAEAAESAGASGRPVKSGGAAEGAAAAAGAGNADDAGSAKSTVNAEGAGSAKSTGNTEAAGSAKSTGNAEGAGSAKSTGNAEGAGSAKSTGNAEGAESAKSTGNAEGAESAKSTGNAEGAGSAKSTGNAEGAVKNAGALLTKLQGVLTELRGTLPQLTDQAGAAAQPEGDAPPAAAGQDTARAAAAPRGDSPAAAQQLGQAPAPAQDAESWVGRVLKLLGAEHEQQAVRGGMAAAGGREAALPPAALQAAAGGGADAAADTLKGVLLQVMGSSEAPPAVKDAAGQLVAQLTGQQLLLNTDRTAPFAQVTLFLPLRGPDGEETASVHIQSRRGRKGELDAANCRLWFDLDMKQLGQTLVDVQVVDRIVSLKLHNNDPWVLELLEGRREDVAAAVESIGYQLLSLRTEPLPELKAASGLSASAKLSDFTPDSYKGVDFRI